MRVGHWNLQHLPIPAKILRIGGRQLELLVHPARAAALQRLPRACCARAHTALPQCLGDCVPFQKFKTKASGRERVKPLFPSFSSS